MAFVPGPGSSRDEAGAGGQAAAGAGARARGTREDAIEWVLLRVAGDPAGRVLVYDRTEWLSFVDGAANGEFDFAGELPDAADHTGATLRAPCLSAALARRAAARRQLAPRTSGCGTGWRGRRAPDERRRS